MIQYVPMGTDRDPYPEIPYFHNGMLLLLLLLLLLH